MPDYYLYELWNGKEVVGHYGSIWPLMGTHIRIFEMSELKQPYGVKPKSIECPISYRIVSDNKIDRVMRTVIDVRRKSKRQIEILAAHR